MLYWFQSGVRKHNMFQSDSFYNCLSQYFFIIIIISMCFHTLCDLSMCFWPLCHGKTVISNLNCKLHEKMCSLCSFEFALSLYHWMCPSFRTGEKKKRRFTAKFHPLHYNCIKKNKASSQYKKRLPKICCDLCENNKMQER